MRKYLKYIILAVLSTLLLLSGGCSKKDNVAGTPSDTAAAAETAVTNAASEDETEDGAALDEGGSYTSKEDVALYIYTYGKLPENFITKKEAKKICPFSIPCLCRCMILYIESTTSMFAVR